MKVRISKLRYVRTTIVLLVVVAAVATIAVVGYRYVTRDTSPIPPTLRAQLTFSPFVLPKESKTYTTTDYKFSTAEGNVQILSYLIHLNNSTITVSEYAQPSQFAEIPGYKDSFLSNVIQQYATVQTSNGTIYLGRLPRQNNQQLAIMVERGLLVLMSPNKEINGPQWRTLVEQFEIEKIAN